MIWLTLRTPKTDDGSKVLVNPLHIVCACREASDETRIEFAYVNGE